MSDSIEMPQFDFRQILKQMIKYTIEGLAIAIAAFYIPYLFTKGMVKPTIMQVVSIGITGSLVMAILDQYSPMVSVGVRQGAGLGIGFNMVKAPM
jgi:hypothetical protein